MYPVSLLDTYEWYFIVFLLFSLMFWQMSAIGQENHVTIYRIDCVRSSGLKDGEINNPVEIRYSDLGGKSKEKKIFVREIKSYPNEALCWNSSLVRGNPPIKGTSSKIRIIPIARTKRDLMLGFPSVEQMKMAYSLLRDQESDTSTAKEPNILLNPLKVFNVTNITFMSKIYFIPYFAALCVWLFSFYLFYSTYLGAGSPSSRLNFSSPIIAFLIIFSLLLAGLIIAIVRKVVRDRARYFKNCDKL